MYIIIHYLCNLNKTIYMIHKSFIVIDIFIGTNELSKEFLRNNFEVIIPYDIPKTRSICYYPKNIIKQSHVIKI